MKTPKKNHASKPVSTLDAIRALITHGNVSTQEDICLLLAKQGISVNQSKVSRLLRKLGAVKAFNHQKESVYSLPLEPLPPLQSQPGHILNITANETMVVIRTSPGSASLIARLLDHHAQELQILGTLAGDDTLFVVPRSIKMIKKLVVMIKELLEGE